MGIGRRQRDLDAGFEFVDADGDFEQGPADGLEGCLSPERFPRCGLAKLVQQPIGTGVQEEPELVGLPTVTRCAVGFGVELHLLDHVFHPAPGAIDLFVEMLGPAVQVGDDEAYVGALWAGLDAGDDLALP